MPLDPANARVFVRFSDASGTGFARIAGAAITVPTAAALKAPMSAKGWPAPRWALGGDGARRAKASAMRGCLQHAVCMA
ncbi:MAG: hypothetical protein Q9M45_03150 [Robiginitomaculum sp.]|nr:hypothetical protein [Robiginitomaculum sp.]